MRRSLFQYILCILPAEMAQTVRMGVLGLVGKIPLGKWVIRRCYAPKWKSLEREVFGLHFRNPIGVGSGFDANGERLEELAALGFGFVEIGSVVPRPQPGTPRPRIKYLRRLHSFVDNSGYPSRGMEYVLERVRKRSKHTKNLIIGCNIGKLTATHVDNCPKEYLRVFRNMYQYVDFFVINIACNTAAKRFVPRTREEILAIVEPLFEFRRGQLDYRPILLKISPDLTKEELDTVIDILIETPLDGIEAVAGSLDLMPKYKGAATGALLTKRAIEVVRYIAERTDHNYPIIGTGGIMSPEDVEEMLAAGASLVSLNSGIKDQGFKLLRASAQRIKTEGGEQTTTTENSENVVNM